MQKTKSMISFLILSFISLILNSSAVLAVDMEAGATATYPSVVTNYINNTISADQDTLNTAIYNLINTAHNTLRPDLEPVNVQIGSEVNAVIEDTAGNLSSESTPVEVIPDAINEHPLIVISQPWGSEQIGSDTYEILWQAVDPDPDDTLAIDIQYTNALNQILVDNFNDEDYFNSLDAWSESWNYEGAAIETIFNNDPTLIYGDTGLSLQLNYDVTYQISSQSGFWTGLATQLDMSAYEQLSFLVKGAIGQEVFEIGLKDLTSAETKLLITNYLPDGVTAEWQMVTIPLTDFSDIDTAFLENLSIGFTNSIGSGAGTIYVDEIRFMRWQDIALGEANDCAYTWDISTLPRADRYLVKLTATDLEGLQDEDKCGDYFSLAVNLAKNKPASASSEENQYFPPSNAADGNPYTRWSSQFSDPQWYQIDLGEEKPVNKVILNWEAAYGKSYAIEVSNDSLGWQIVYSTTVSDGGIDEIEFDTVSARYIRFYGTERATVWGGYSLWEFEVYYDIHYANVMASSVEGAGLEAEKASDGDLNTRWASDWSDNEWIYIDFGTPKSFNTVILEWEIAYGKSYQLQISNDATHWQDIYSTTTGDGGIDEIRVPAVNARYLRMYGTECGTGWGYSLWEMATGYK